MGNTYIEDCYVIGTALLYLNELSFDRLEKTKYNLIERGMDVTLTPDSIRNCVLEWRDFFRMTENNTIVLTETTPENKLVVEVIFSDVLDFCDKKILLDSIFNVPIRKKNKVLKFPKSF